MKQTCTLLLALLFSLTALATPQPDYSKLAPHPRLILKSGDIEALQKKIDSDELIRMLHFRIEDEAAQILLEAPATRNMVGKRLLDKSRLALKRICFCSYMYLISKDEQYARRAEKEMLAVAQFSDWNPKHFLDVGEMLAAVAIGYDWLYDWLSEDSRKIIETAIIEKGLRAATPKMWWYRSDNNWNQGQPEGADVLWSKWHLSRGIWLLGVWYLVRSDAYRVVAYGSRLKLRFGESSGVLGVGEVYEFHADADKQHLQLFGYRNEQQEYKPSTLLVCSRNGRFVATLHKSQIATRG